MINCTEKDYGRDLHDYLNEMSPDCTIKLYDNDGNVLFEGYAGNITEKIMFLGWKVDSHSWHNKMIIWIF